MSKKDNLIAGGVLAGAILTAVIVSTIILASRRPGATGYRPDATPAAEMLERYAKGRVDAEIFYNDKVLSVSGTVQRIYTDDAGAETGLMLAERTPDTTPIAIVGQFFGRENRAAVLALRPGMRVVIRGQCKGNFQSGRTGLYHVILHDAKLIWSE